MRKLESFWLSAKAGTAIAARIATGTTKPQKRETRT